MDLTKYLTVLVVLCLEGGETGGGGKHHDHVRLHIPEFIHHDHHKKVITIHHHHHKPKKEHHHHHHHHKPQIPYGHNYHHHHKKVQTKSHTESKGGHHHGHHQAKHGHHGHHGHHGKHGHHGQEHHGHGHSHHHEAPNVPSFTYTPSSVPSYEDEYTSSFSPSVPSFGGGYSNPGFSAPQTPHVHGITHTVKQVKVFDSLPGALPNKGISHGYEVTEEGEDDDDVFTTVNQLQNRFPATFGYVRSAGAQPTNDPYSEITSQGAIPTHFAAAPEPTSALSGGIESFTGNVQSDPFVSSAPTQSIGLPGVQSSVDYPENFQGDSFDGQLNSFIGSDGKDGSFISNEENGFSDETPLSFTREAGIQHTTNTGNVETVVY